MTLIPFVIPFWIVHVPNLFTPPKKIVVSVLRWCVRGVRGTNEEMSEQGLVLTRMPALSLCRLRRIRCSSHAGIFVSLVNISAKLDPKSMLSWHEAHRLVLVGSANNGCCPHLHKFGRNFL